MKYTKVRNKVFETNSSSCHSISIHKDDVETYHTLYPDKEGVLTFTGGEFGWEFAKYHDAITKAEYIVTLFKVHGKSDQELFERVVLDHTGASRIEYDIKGEDYAYIDHQSRENPKEPILNLTYETMKDFIFNPNSVLMTGNDNDDRVWVNEELVIDEDEHEYYGD
jgi:hypothetical protein